MIDAIITVATSKGTKTISVAKLERMARKTRKRKHSGKGKPAKFGK